MRELSQSARELLIFQGISQFAIADCAGTYIAILLLHSCQLPFSDL